ncbi:MAG TPA: Rieske 2Fe-2S domain-containing protein [bacterium]|nr:Rieske 2Fe-2S domain-containing protein [bacterium]
MNDAWHDLGPVEVLKDPPLREIQVGPMRVALSYANGEFAAIGGVCPHAGGPLGEGTLKDEKISCPWHSFRYDRRTGVCRLGESLEFAVPSYPLKIKDGRLFVSPKPATKGRPMPEYEDELTRPIRREPGPTRVAGISTTVMDARHPRYSTSETLLQAALDHARDELKAETRLIRMNDLRVRHCEGYYSKSSHACLWPCTITRGDENDQMDRIYEAMVHWADVLLVATPIRWGAASSLYYKMVERLNCVQNQITLHNNVLIRNKVASFLIIGGQDNVQLVAGQMMGFFAELGFVFPPFPYIAHSLGWAAENMERNVKYVKKSRMLHEGAKDLVRRAVEMSKVLLESPVCTAAIERAGRKAHAGTPPDQAG